MPRVPRAGVREVKGEERSVSLDSKKRSMEFIWRRGGGVVVVIVEYVQMNDSTFGENAPT